MKKQKRIYTICLPILGAFLLTEILLFAFSVISVWAFLALSVAFLGLIALNIYLLVRTLQKIKQLEKEKEKEKFVSSGNYMQDLYGLLGIPIQYNPDGTVKDIYDLLGIEPIYDDNGDRILTIYELLGIMPMFDQNGKEIPSVLVIKNRVKRFAKVDLSSRVLHRRLTDKEREEILIRQTLRKQMEIAEQNNDKAKVNKIKKVLKEKSEESSKSKFVLAKPGKLIQPGKPATTKHPNIRLFDSPKVKGKEKEKEKPAPPKEGETNTKKPPVEKVPPAPIKTEGTVKNYSGEEMVVSSRRSYDSSASPDRERGM